jgi:hypothetical protein
VPRHLIRRVFLEEMAAWTVISVWFGQARQNSRCAPTRIAPGSALTKSFGTWLRESQSA